MDIERDLIRGMLFSLPNISVVGVSRLFFTCSRRKSDISKKSRSIVHKSAIQQCAYVLFGWQGGLLLVKNFSQIYNIYSVYNAKGKKVLFLWEGGNVFSQSWGNSGFS